MSNQKTRLLKTYETVDSNTLDDMIYLAALNVEDALLTGGAVPGVDYQIIDLYRLGMPFAMKFYESHPNPTHVAGHPSGQQLT